MTTIPIEVSTEQLLRAVERLPPQEFDAFVSRIVALRAQRTATALSQEETTLLLQINAGLSAAHQRRYDELVAKRQAETITPAELQELIQMTDVIEQQDAHRLAALIDLAHLRKTTVSALMNTLGIRISTHA